MQKYCQHIVIALEAGKVLSCIDVPENSLNCDWYGKSCLVSWEAIEKKII